MYEYELLNKTTNEHFFIWGRTYENAMMKHPEYAEYELINSEYVD